MAGRCPNVLVRIVLAAALLALVAAGCGGTARPGPRVIHGVPRTLAAEWQAQASKVADAAAAGHDCLALHLASSLRDEIISDQARLPQRLYAPLVTGANALADRIVCKATVTTAHKKPPEPPKHHKPHDDHHHKDHGDEQGNHG
jgi:hypothetical protein